MDNRERMLMGAHGFDWHWWIFDVSFSVLSLREIKSPHWLALLLCKFGKHAWWLDSEIFKFPATYKCSKCGILTKRAGDTATPSDNATVLHK